MEKDQFVLKKEHIKLVRRLNIYQVEQPYSGGPQIDTKRPYRDSNIEMSIAEILGLKIFEDAEGEKHLSADQESWCLELHKQMGTALQVILSAGSFKPGLYQTEAYADEWKRTK